MATFGLIHGAWHGAWCWERLVPLLEARGHGVRTPDLAVDDRDADLRDHTRTIVDALAGAPDPVILVGHSMGGALLPLVAAARPVRHQVYLGAILHPALLPTGWPGPHAPGTWDGLERFPDRSHRWRSLDVAAPRLYNRCTPGDAAWAFAHLRRQQTARAWADVPVPTPWPVGPVSSIVCTDDRVVVPAWSERAARELLRVVPLHLDADHSPFLSDPAALADLLAAIAAGDTA
ncbi:MAG: alpha/beta hydrolase [Chloroflexota bacterium]